MTEPHETTGRWPGWVYDTGEEPDVRFTFANERTFLAWIRTALALLATGVALEAVQLPMNDGVQRALSVEFFVLGILCTVASWTRWARAERAMRRQEPLPASWAIVALVAGVLVAAVTVLLGG
jgi:putative membrane protein